MPATQKQKKSRAKGRPPAKRPTPRPTTPPRQVAEPRRPLLPAWPRWLWAWIGLAALFFVLRAGGAIRSVPLCIYLSAVAGAVCFSLEQLRGLRPVHRLLQLRRVVLVLVLVAIPPLMDPSTGEIENLPRLVVLVVAAVILVAAWALDATLYRWRPDRLVNGFQWVLLAVVVWFGITTATSLEPRISLLGRYGTYEGFLLIAALAVLACGLAEAFTIDALPALLRVVVASTVPVVVYGLIQVYGFDVDTSAHPDFVHWHAPFHNVFATFGNPNHLGGFLATVVPFGVVTAVLARRRAVKVALWVWVAAVLLLLLQTAARGAWLGTLAAAVVLGFGLLPRLRARAGLVGLGVGGVVVVAVVLVAAGSRFLGAKATALFKFGSGTSVAQRPLYWEAALHSAAHHPLVGTGPDTWADTYSRYQSATLAHQIGNVTFVDGAHNIFFSWLSNEGIPGLLLLVALFAIGLTWGIRTWRSPVLESLGPPAAFGDADGTAPAVDARWARYVVVATVAALVGYIVQACFDIEQVATLFILFVVLGFLAVANRGTWPAAVLRRVRAPFGSVSDIEDLAAEEDTDDYPVLEPPPRRKAGPGEDTGVDLRRAGPIFAAAVLGLAAVGVTAWRMDALWRADHQELVGSPQALAAAASLNPWEPSYLFRAGEQNYQHYLQINTGGPLSLPVIQKAVADLADEVALVPYSTDAQTDYGETLFALAEHQHSTALLRSAINALEQAKVDDPYNTVAGSLITKAEKFLR